MTITAAPEDVALCTAVARKEDSSYREEGYFTVRIQQHSYWVPRHCPHRAGRLDHGHVNEQRKTITCPLHHSVFSLESGEQLSGPACGRLAVCPTTTAPAVEAGAPAKDQP